MTGFGLALVLAPVVIQSPAADSLRFLAGRLPESALVLEIRARPLAVRDETRTEVTSASTLPALRSAAEIRESGVRTTQARPASAQARAPAHGRDAAAHRR